MAKFNPTAKSATLERKIDTTQQTAGGYGVYAAKQDAYHALRRMTLACMLGENIAYASGKSVMEDIAMLVPQVSPQLVADLAIEVRNKQKIRHAALFLAREMARHTTHRPLVGNVLRQIIKRPDEMTDFLALYWKDGKQPLANGAKKALADVFANFNEYQLAKYDRDNAVKLRDVMFLTHPKPKDVASVRTRKERKLETGQKALSLGEQLFERVVNRTLVTPDTWEVALSTGKDKKTTWERLIAESKLGALAFLRNLRNMTEAGVDQNIVRSGFDKLKPDWLLPLNFYAAWKVAPMYQRQLDLLMQRCYELYPKLTGMTVVVIDVSGSTHTTVSDRSQLNRLDVEIALATMAIAVSDNVVVYITAGDDGARKHSTMRIPPMVGLGLGAFIESKNPEVGGGGIFTRQCLEFIKDDLKGIVPERIIILSDSQDCDVATAKLPKPFGKYNYIVDVSSHKPGIAYDGLWTAEISGVSEATIQFITELEKSEVQ